MLSIIDKQLRKAAGLVNVNPNLLTVLSKPMNEIKVNFPVKINDKIEVFSGTEGGFKVLGFGFDAGER